MSSPTNVTYMWHFAQQLLLLILISYKEHLLILAPPVDNSIMSTTTSLNKDLSACNFVLEVSENKTQCISKAGFLISAVCRMMKRSCISLCLIINCNMRKVKQSKLCLTVIPPDVRAASLMNSSSFHLIIYSTWRSQNLITELIFILMTHLQFNCLNRNVSVIYNIPIFRNQYLNDSKFCIVVNRTFHLSCKRLPQF